MIKCASIYTYEIDNQEMAFQEIKEQINKKLSLKDNTIGIIMCHTEFILSGTLKYICEKLPFDVVGVTTASQAVNDTTGEVILTLFVITADDVIFKSGVTECLNDDIETHIKKAYEKASCGMKEEPNLALIFPPLILKYAGDIYPQIWSDILPNTPNFGTFPTDDSVTFEGSETIYNGDNSRTKMPFILCYGNIKPRFLVGTLPDNNLLPYQGIITKSNGPFVSEINNVNSYTYFENLGFANNGSLADNFLFVPFMLDLKKRNDYDGIPVIRVLTAFTDNGAAIFRGNMDENSMFTLSKCDENDVINTAIEKVNEINKMSDVNGVLMFSCIIRRMVLGANTLNELNTVKDRMNNPFMMGYAGGEVCPTSIKNGFPANRFHNYSFISLII